MLFPKLLFRQAVWHIVAVLVHWESHYFLLPSRQAAVPVRGAFSLGHHDKSRDTR
jgi:hypothetical protein